MSVSIFSKLKKRDVFYIAEMWLLFLFALVVRVIVAFQSDNFDGHITFERVFNALDILRNPWGPENIRAAFGPVHPYLMALFLHVWPNILWAPRVISMISGALLIFPFYTSVRYVMGDENALFSSLLLCVFPFHVAKSVVSMPASLFHLFVFVSLCFIILVNQQKKTRFLLLWYAGCFMALACLTRYEGIVLVPLFAWFINSRRWQGRIRFLVPVAIAVGGWCVVNYFYYQDPFHFLHMSDVACKAEIGKLKQMNVLPFASYYRNYITLIFAIPYELSRMMPVVLYLFMMFGFLMCAWKRKFLFFVLPPSLLYVIFLWKMSNATWVLQSRYLIILTLFLLPFAVYVIQVLIEKLSRSQRQLVLILSTTVFIMLSVVYVQCVKPKIPDFVKDVAYWLRDHVKEDEQILLDHDKLQLYQNNIIAESAIPRDRFFSVHSIYKNKDKKVTKDWVLPLLKYGGVKYIVYSPDSYFLSGVFKFSPDSMAEEDLWGYRFTLRTYAQGNVTDGSFAIYEVNKIQ